jgi:HPt (histidine-containing phosphotransfer) domain-containing protein
MVKPIFGVGYQEEQMPESVIDENVFNDLKETVGADYISELVSIFMTEVPELIAQLRPALAVENIEGFRRAAHSIKSNAATFGAMQLFELARELEYMARENRLAEVGNQVELLEEFYGFAVDVMKEMCS